MNSTEEEDLRCKERFKESNNKKDDNKLQHKDEYGEDTIEEKHYVDRPNSKDVDEIKIHILPKRRRYPFQLINNISQTITAYEGVRDYS